MPNASTESPATPLPSYGNWRPRPSLLIPTSRFVLAVSFGFLMAFFAFCCGIYIFVRVLLYSFTCTGVTLFVSLYFIGGMIIANLGILGIYLGKTFDESKKRPLYIVRRVTFNEQST